MYRQRAEVRLHAARRKRRDHINQRRAEGKDVNLKPGDDTLDEDIRNYKKRKKLSIMQHKKKRALEIKESKRRLKKRALQRALEIKEAKLRLKELEKEYNNQKAFLAGLMRSK